MRRVAADVPQLIRYQGQAVDANGVPLEGPYKLTFRLYDAETGGTSVWQETQINVTLSKGQFSVLLGQVTPLTPLRWDTPCWLSVQVNDEPELAPRQRITSVPLALRAKTAEELSVPVTTSTITDDANRLVPSGAVILWTSASCPVGYTRLTVLDGKFLVSDAAYNPAAGGSNTHTHSGGSYAGPSHTHSVPYNGWGAPTIGGSSGQLVLWTTSSLGAAQANNVTGTSGTGPVTGTSAPADSRPAFAAILLCQKD